MRARVLRLLLAFFPRGFRERQGRDLLQTWHDEYGGETAPLFWYHVISDALFEGLAARLESLWQDFRLGARSLSRSPGFTFVILLTLALGIGANTAIFSVVDGVLLRPLPYRSGDRLVKLLQPARGAEVDDAGFSPLEVKDYREQLRSLEGVVEYHSMSFTLLGGSEPRRVQTGVVSGDFFSVLGLFPMMGRGLTPEDAQPGAPAVLVLSYEYWQLALAGDRGIVGRTFTMNDKTHTVVGVLPPVPQYPDVNDVYMPVTACPFRAGNGWAMNRGARGLTVFARLRPGASLEGVRSDLATVASRLHAQYPADYLASRGYETTALPLQQALTSNVRPALLALLGTAAFLLLIVCANVANLTLSRLVRREREMAVRTALGASRGALFQQLFAEGLLLSLAGGTLGVLAAHWGVDLLAAFAARYTTRAAEIRVDFGVLLFALGVSLFTGLVLGALPALPSRSDLMSDLKDSGATTPGRGRMALRSVLTVAQVAVSFTLLVGAGLMLRSLLELHRVDAGFDAQSTLTARADLNWTRYDRPAKLTAFADKLIARLQGQPGVTAVALANAVPLNPGPTSWNPFLIEGREIRPDEPSPQFEFGAVSPDYFRTLGVPLLRGRIFGAADRPPATPVVLVNEALVKRYFPGGDALGHRISGDNGTSWVPIVGVVGDVRQHDLSRPSAPAVYSSLGFTAWRDLRVLVRGAAEPRVLEAAVRAAVRELDPDQPVTHVRTLEEVRSAALGGTRLVASLLAIFAGLALVLTGTGIAGVIAFSVSQRTREFGIRLALGAAPASVVKMVLGQGLRLVAIGLLLGAVGAVALSRILSGALYGVPASDPVTYALVALLLLFAGAAACFMPACRATSADPMTSLRAT